MVQPHVHMSDPPGGGSHFGYRGRRIGAILHEYHFGWRAVLCRHALGWSSVLNVEHMGYESSILLGQHVGAVASCALEGEKPCRKPHPGGSHTVEETM
jgi:hypothetical protein